MHLMLYSHNILASKISMSIILYTLSDAISKFQIAGIHYQ